MQFQEFTLKRVSLMYYEVKNIPIVFLTAVVKKEEEASHGGIIGGKTFIAKPTTVQELIKVIEKQLKSE